MSLETLNLVADGGRRDVKLSSSKLEASKAGNGFEGSKRPEGREAAHLRLDELDSLIAEKLRFDMYRLAR